MSSCYNKWRTLRSSRTLGAHIFPDSVDFVVTDDVGCFGAPWQVIETISNRPHQVPGSKRVDFYKSHNNHVMKTFCQELLSFIIFYKTIFFDTLKMPKVSNRYPFCRISSNVYTFSLATAVMYIFNHWLLLTTSYFPARCNQVRFHDKRTISQQRRRTQLSWCSSFLIVPGKN